MKLKYKNCTIENDGRCFVVNKLGIDKNGKEYVKDVVYPATLDKALLRLKTFIDLDSSEELDIEQYIETVHNNNMKFLKGLQDLLGTNKQGLEKNGLIK